MQSIYRLPEKVVGGSLTIALLKSQKPAAPNITSQGDIRLNPLTSRAPRRIMIMRLISPPLTGFHPSFPD
jgi:hypothetical protein